LINDTNNNYMKNKIPYSYNLSKKLFKTWNESLNELEKYFIEQIEYYFNWWEELQKTSDFINKLKRFYKLNYEINNNKAFKNFDVNSVSILDVISMYIKIPNNLNRNIVCPLHKEKTWSFKIYTNTNSYYCFGCKSWWNAVNFVSEIENIKPIEAYIKLANLYSNKWNYEL
jgi:hypothetical protein